MKFAGKPNPDLEEMQELYEAGYEHFELYLTTELLDERKPSEIVSECREAPGTVSSVHTPHIDLDEHGSEYFAITDEIARRLDARLVVDSNPIGTRYASDVFPPEAVEAPLHGYENDPSVSPYYLEVNHLSQGLPLVLDTAHLHMSSNRYKGFIEKVLEKYSAEQVPVIHLADGVRTNDGVPFGEGSVDIEGALDLLEAHDYDGLVVLEVPLDSQPDALDMVTEYLEG